MKSPAPSLRDLAAGGLSAEREQCLLHCRQFRQKKRECASHPRRGCRKTGKVTPPFASERLWRCSLTFVKTLRYKALRFYLGGHASQAALPFANSFHALPSGRFRLRRSDRKSGGAHRIPAQTVDKPLKDTRKQPAQKGSDARSQTGSGRERTRTYVTALIRCRRQSRWAFFSRLNGGAHRIPAVLMNPVAGQPRRAPITRAGRARRALSRRWGSCPPRA